MCEHSSDMEQLAASAERASIKYKQVEYMSERIGQVFDGGGRALTEPEAWIIEPESLAQWRDRGRNVDGGLIGGLKARKQ